MKFLEHQGSDILMIESPAFGDERGAFVKFFDERINMQSKFAIRQVNYVETLQKHTCRGLHFQQGEWAESKIFRFIRGSALLVVVDVRVSSPNFKQYYSFELSNPAKAVWVPRGYATGYCTLEHNTSVLYFSDNHYNSASECGIRWDDPCLKGKVANLDHPIISEKDLSWPDF